jgi:hypothetical protein
VRLRRSLTNNAKALLFLNLAFGGQQRKKTKNFEMISLGAPAKDFVEALDPAFLLRVVSTNGMNFEFAFPTLVYGFPVIVMSGPLKKLPNVAFFDSLHPTQSILSRTKIDINKQFFAMSS